MSIKLLQNYLHLCYVYQWPLQMWVDQDHRCLPKESIPCPTPIPERKHFFSVGNHSRTVSQVLTYVVQTCKVQNFFPTTLYYANPTLQKSVVQFG